MKKVKSKHVDINVDDLWLTTILIAVGVIGVIAGALLLIYFGV